MFQKKVFSILPLVIFVILLAFVSFEDMVTGTVLMFLFASIPAVVIARLNNWYRLSFFQYLVGVVLTGMVLASTLFLVNIVQDSVSYGLIALTNQNHLFRVAAIVLLIGALSAPAIFGPLRLVYEGRN